MHLPVDVRFRKGFGGGGALLKEDTAEGTWVCHILLIAPDLIANDNSTHRRLVVVKLAVHNYTLVLTISMSTGIMYLYTLPDLSF